MRQPAAQRFPQARSPFSGLKVSGHGRAAHYRMQEPLPVFQRECLLEWRGVDVADRTDRHPALGAPLANELGHRAGFQRDESLRQVSVTGHYRRVPADQEDRETSLADEAAVRRAVQNGVQDAALDRVRVADEDDAGHGRVQIIGASPQASYPAGRHGEIGLHWVESACRAIGVLGNLVGILPGQREQQRVQVAGWHRPGPERGGRTRPRWCR